MLSDQVPYFILDLLQQNPTVHVKGLGRFEAIFHPAVMDEPGYRIKPPYVQPEFNEQEIEEDALLPAYIRYTNGADISDIEHAIAEFVDRIKVQVEQTGNFAIDHFGSFSKNAQGNLRFTPDWDAFNLSFRGLEVIDLRPQAEPYDGTRFTSEHVTPAPVLPPADIEAPAPVETEEPAVMPNPEVIPVVPPTTSMDETSARLWWTILASALVLITVLCAYLAWDILSSRKKLDELIQFHPDSIPAITIVPAPVLPDTTATMDSPVPTTSEKKIEQPKVVQPQNTPPDPSACYIVVGAFKDKANVVRMEERITSLGLEPEKISGGTLTRVAIRTSCDKQILQQALNDARAKLNPEAWIY